MLSTERLAYMAGVIDSLGRLRARDTDSGLLPEVTVSSANTAPLVVLAAATGVRVVTVRRDYQRLGCGEHCTQRHLHVNSTTGRWQLTGYRATVVLTALLPYLVRHHEHAELLIGLGLAAGHKPSTARDMRALGWPTLPARTTR